MQVEEFKKHGFHLQPTNNVEEWIVFEKDNKHFKIFKAENLENALKIAEKYYNDTITQRTKESA